MAESTSKPLPDFLRPPVIEVVYGLQFAPLIEWRTPLIGALWQEIKTDYPGFKEMPVLAPVIERYDQTIQADRPTIEVLDGPPVPRLFFLDRYENWVMQVQNDRFLHNWKRMKEEDLYPRFGLVSERFFKAWDRFSNFLESHGISTPQLTQFELTYINHIPVETGRSTVEESEAIFSNLRSKSDYEFLPRPDTVTWNTSFLLPEQQGRLHISLRPGQRRKDKASILLLELTARGIPASTEPENIRRWFTMGREWIVRGFSDITDKSVQIQRWGRKV